MELVVYSLENCYYSMSAEDFLNENYVDKKNKKTYRLQRVNQENKMSYKEYNKMNTFPQIFLESSNDKIKIGGYNDLKEIVGILKNKKNNFDDILSKLNSRYDKRDALVLIKFFIQ